MQRKVNVYIVVLDITFLCASLREASAAMVLEFYKGTSINDTVISNVPPITSVSIENGPAAFVQVVLRQIAPTALLTPSDGLEHFHVLAQYGSSHSGVFKVPATSPGGTIPRFNVADPGTYTVARDYWPIEFPFPRPDENTADGFEFGGVNLHAPPSPSVDTNGRIFLGTFMIQLLGAGSSAIYFMDPPESISIDNATDMGDDIDSVLFPGSFYSYTLLINPAFPCVNAADCRMDPLNNACNHAACSSTCSYTCTKFGDVKQPANGVVNIDDVLCSLGGFAAIATCPDADINPCGGNGVINLDDILSELTAFAGTNQCACTENSAPGTGVAPLCGSTAP